MISHQLGIKNFIKRFILIFTTVIIYYFLLKDVELENIFFELSQAKLIYILYAFLLSLIFVLLSGQKWKLLIEMMGYKISFARCQKITIATYALNVIIPSKGGDFIKSWSLRDIVSIYQGFGIVILERLIDLSLLCLMTSIGSLYINNEKLKIFSFSLLFVLLSSLIVMNKFAHLKMKNKFMKKVKEISYAAQFLFNNLWYAVFIVTIGIIIWLGSAFQVFILYKSVGQDIPFMYIVAVVPIALFVGFVPITIAGMGTRDAMLVYLFSAYASTSASISVGLFFSLLRYWVLALIGIPFLGNLYSRVHYKPD